MQFYVVTGGQGVSGQDRTGKGIILASTEILKISGGHSWQRAASLPSARTYLSGVSLDSGKFLVTGEVVKILITVYLSFYVSSALNFGGGAKNNGFNSSFCRLP